LTGNFYNNDGCPIIVIVTVGLYIVTTLPLVGQPVFSEDERRREGRVKERKKEREMREAEGERERREERTGQGMGRKGNERLMDYE